MTDPTQLKALAQRCEEATAEQHRELLTEAFIAVHGPIPAIRPEGTLARRFERLLDAKGYESAALMLVPEGRGYIYKRHGIKSVVRAQIESGDRTTFVQGDAATLALAITAAALRAHAARELAERAMEIV